MNNNSDELLDPWEVGGRDRAKRLAAYFNRSWGGRLYILDKCGTVSDARRKSIQRQRKGIFWRIDGRASAIGDL